MIGLLAVAVEADAPAGTTFAVMTDWPRHHEWMIGTRARGEGRQGGRIEARTGIGPLGFTDPMVITEWTPPHRARVRHLGRVVRGEAVFAVRSLPGGRCRIIWAERLDLPLGPLGPVGWTLVRPVAAAALRASLRRLARIVEA